MSREPKRTGTGGGASTVRAQWIRLALLGLLTGSGYLFTRGPEIQPTGNGEETTVAITRADTALRDYAEVRALVAEAVELALGPGGFANLVAPDDTVFLKINANETSVPMGLPPDGYLTDPDVVRAVADLVTEIVPAAQVTVGEGISHNGYDELAEFMWGGYDMDLDGELDGVPGVRFVCLNAPHDPDHAKDTEYVTRFDNAPGHQATTWWLPNAMVNADVRISVPVVKAHNEAGLTCAMKNSVGILPADIYYSGTYQRSFEVRLPIHEPSYPHGPPAAIADINAIAPYDFVVADMLTAHRYGPWSDAPDRILPNAIVAGRDAVALDTVVAAAVGWDPTSIDYIVFAANDGTGTCDPARIAVRGLTVAGLRNAISASYPGKLPFPEGTGGAVNNGAGTTLLETAAPWAAIASPGTGETVSGSVDVVFTCGDGDRVARAELLVDGAVVDSVGDPGDGGTLTWSTDGVGPGAHDLAVRVFDPAFNETEATVGVIVPASFTGLALY